MATGDQSGSWGTVTNTNLELIAEAFSYSTEAITTNADTHTTTIADGATDPGRSMFLKYTGTLDSACTITIGPNTVSKLWFIENATSGSQNIIIKQGSGATVTIASGKTKVIYSDGVGSGAKMVDAFAALDVGSMSVDNITIDGNEIDVSSGDLTLDVAGDIILDAASNDVIFSKNGTERGRILLDAADFKIQSTASNADIIFNGNDGGSTITALTLDMSASGRATFNNNVVVTDNNSLVAGSGDDLQISYDGSNGEIDVSSGNLTLDVAGNMFLDADGSLIVFRDGGLEYGRVGNDSSNFVIHSLVNDKDIQFKGLDNGTVVTALTLDMSDAGAAHFNTSIYLGDGKSVKLGASSDLQLYHDGSDSYIDDQGVGSLRLRSNRLRIEKYTGENMIEAYGDGAVELYYDNSKKFETTSSGVTVTGKINSGDCRGEVEKIGRDTNDFIAVESTMIDFALDGATDMRLYNSGDLHVEGNVIAYSSTISDERLKKDIVKIDNALDKVSQLNGYTFEYLADGKKSAGVIAQEVEKVMPSAITESTLPLKMGDDDKTEYKTVQYDQLHGLMIEAIKELKAEIEELKAR